MAGKPLAIDSLVVNDGETWRSQLIGAYGLAGAQVLMAKRTGRRPVAAGVEMLGGQYTLRTIWDVASHPPRKLNRAALMKLLDPEKKVSRRLTMAEHVWPGAGGGSVLLSMGPLDVYGEADGDWHARDVLRGSDLVMDLDGSWYTSPGEGLQCAEGFTNHVPNPCGTGTYTAGIANGYASYTTGTGAGTHSEETSIVRYGNQAQRITKTDGGADNFGVTETTAAIGATAGNLSLWIYVVSYTATAQVSIRADGSVTGASAIIKTETLTAAHVGVWTLLTENATGLDAAETFSLRAFIKTADADIIVDGWQLTATAYRLPTAHGDMPGCGWTGTAHASTSTWAASDNTAADLALPLRTGTIRGWLKTSADMDDCGTNRWLWHFGGANGVILKIATTDALRANFGGGANLDFATLTPSTFAADTWHCVHLVWDIDVGVICYLNGAKLGDTKTYTYPTDDGGGLDVGCFGTVNPFPGFIYSVLVLDVAMGAAEAALDYANGLEIEARHVDVRCEAADPWRVKGRESDKGVVSTLLTDGDVRWRMRDGDFVRHVMRDDTYSFVLDNDGDAEAKPIFHITPRTAKTGGYAYKDWWAVKWRVASSTTLYPYDICNNGFNTQALVSGGKMQADGDDLRVMVDGVEVDRWLDGINTTTTKVWANFNWQANVEMTLLTAIADSGDVSVIEVNESIAEIPSTGILYIDSEAFTYTSKNNADKRFLGVARAAKGTSMAAHTADTTVWWIQHDVWIVYGNAAVSAPAADDNYKPAFELDHSTNTSWVYEAFGEDDGLRAGQWVFDYKGPQNVLQYGGDHGATADPWVELGFWKNAYNASLGRLQIYNPCVITNANFTNGEKYWPSSTVNWDSGVDSSADGYSFDEEYAIPQPTATMAWQSWSQSVSINGGSGYPYVALRVGDYITNSAYCQLEAADCTLTLDSSNTPVSASSGEQGNYTLALTIENETTEESITLTADLELDEALIVDTDAQVITYLNESRRDMLTISGGVRQEWLALLTGENTLTFSDTDTEELDVEVVWDRRMY